MVADPIRCAPRTSKYKDERAKLAEQVLGLRSPVLNEKSGRRDSNSRMVAWEATALPLGYARMITIKILP